MDRPQCVYIFPNWWSFGLFPNFGCYQWWCFDNSHTSFFGDICFPSFGQVHRKNISESCGNSYLTYLTHLCKISSIVLNKSRGNGHPLLVLDFNRKLWNYHHWIWCWLCVCHMWNLLCWSMFSLYLVCCVFVMNGCWICQTLFLRLLIMWFLSFVLSVWFITFVVSDYKWKKISLSLFSMMLAVSFHRGPLSD